MHLLALAAFLFSTPSFAATATGNPDGVFMGDLPPVHSVADSQATFDERAKRALSIFTRYNQGGFNNNGVGFWLAAISKLSQPTPKNIQEVNDAILNPAANVYAKVGSDFHDLHPFCERTGDYDFMLRGLTELFYLFGDRPDLLWPKTRQKILYNLLNQTGNQVHLKNTFSFCGTYWETENHVLQTETSRYLTNQARFKDEAAQGKYTWAYDNEANGMNEWMLRHLQQFFQNDFSEYNSHPYQAYTVMAIQNLFEFSADPRVRLAAEMALNYLDAKFAVSSNGLRRLVPFRRQPGYADRTDMLRFDDESQRFIQLAGNVEKLAFNEIPYWLDFATDRMQGFAVGKYRTPELILDLILDKSKGRYFERYSHTGIELYSSSPGFLITGGGVYVSKFDWGSNQLDGFAVATTLMPTAGGIDASEFIQIKGHSDPKKRNNTCVAPGFACGLNPDISPFIPESCISRNNQDWAFIDFTSPQCPLHYGFYIAVYQQPCDTKNCAKGAGSFGFFEAADATPELSFIKFRQRILIANYRKIFHAEAENEYITSDGRHIRFVPLTSDNWSWGIHSIDSEHFDTNIARWPLAQGEILQADRSGRVVIHNPYLRERLELDMRDPMHPRRISSNE